MAGVEVDAVARQSALAAEGAAGTGYDTRKAVSEALNILRFLPHKATEPVAEGDQVGFRQRREQLEPRS